MREMIPSILEKIIKFLLLAGFLILCISYTYLLISVMLSFSLPIKAILPILGLSLLMFSLLGLKLFRRFFVAETEDTENS